MLRSFSSPLWSASVLFAEPADLVLSAGHVVTMDASKRVIENGAVAIQGARIAAVGTKAEIDRLFQPKSAHRLTARDSDSGPDQHAHARADVAAARYRG